MDHVAIDLGSRKSQVCVRNSDGKIVEEKRLETARLKDFIAKKAKTRRSVCGAAR
jgi:predicted NBD/HSP70 family sugar kinase